MQRLGDILEILECELAFASSGGYRSPNSWRARLIFEDSPICCKNRAGGCPRDKCILIGFVPRESLNEPIPCRYIPLTESGEALDTLYRTATNGEIERCLRKWLRMTINQLREERQTVARPNKAAA